MLQAGTAVVDIIPDGEMHLAGTYARRPRIGRTIRDPLMARAVALRDGDRQVVCVSCDLLCISEELHLEAAAAIPGLDPGSLFLTATHTHSAYGGIFHARAGEKMLGAPKPEVFDFLLRKLEELVRDALADLAPARALAGSARVAGLVSSRRQAAGPHDDRLQLLRLERDGRRPIDVVCASGHPVVVSERAPHTVSGDYPGELNRRLEGQGLDPLYMNAALGGVSILFPEFEMDLERHLELVAGLLLQGHAEAERMLRPVAAGPLQVVFRRIDHGPHQARIYSSQGRRGRLLDTLLNPALGWVSRRLQKTLPLKEGVPLHLVTLGDFCLAGSANELGPTVVSAIRDATRRKSYAHTMVASNVDAYAGYLHMPDAYARRPQKGYRFLALYENALGMFGHDFGERVVDAIGKHLHQREI